MQQRSEQFKRWFVNIFDGWYQDVTQSSEAGTRRCLTDNFPYDSPGRLDKESVLQPSFKFSNKENLTLLMAQWVDMRALENKNHASLMLFESLGAIRQISSHESVSSRVVTHRHALSA